MKDLKRTQRPRLFFYLHLPQDTDILLPLMAAAEASGRSPLVWLRKGLEEESPALMPALRARGLAPKTLPWWRLRSGLFMGWRAGDILLTASESTAPPHRLSYHLTRAAKRGGVRCFTLQHGLENVGLTYFDSEYPPGSVEFASDGILIWGQSEALHPKVSEETRSKCITVGVPKSYRVSNRDAQSTGRVRIAIFENLHWSRYDSAYRRAFEQDLFATVSKYPEIDFILKGHPSSDWAKKLWRELEGTANAQLVGAKPGTLETAPTPALLDAVDAVITTPSTVAMDAAFMNRPVAVAAYDLDLSFYEPLVLLRSADDWSSFIDRARAPEYLERAEQFLSAHTVGLAQAARVFECVDNLSC
ncbi:MAG: hypothetical protein H6617_01095 [Bdellovibrionaceae bacterium]|nr:hypothetical protein [Pseudobdellovibrionaceae bacterium]